MCIRDRGVRGNREAQDFLRRQQQRERGAVPESALYVAPPQGQSEPTVQSLSVGTSGETLERTLAKYLIKFGHTDFEVLEEKEAIRYNVASYIFDQLDSDGLTFDIPVYREILATYREQWEQLGEGVEVPAHYFVNHHDPNVNRVAVDLLTSDDMYVISEIWRQKDVHIESDEEQLAQGVPKAMALYKWRFLDKHVDELTHRLTTETLSEEEQSEIMEKLAQYNAVRTLISKMSNRLI